MYSHQWVRSSACKLFGLYFAARDPASVLKGNDYLALPGAIYRAGKLFMKQLESPHLDDALADQVIANAWL